MGVEVGGVWVKGEMVSTYMHLWGHIEAGELRGSACDECMMAPEQARGARMAATCSISSVMVTESSLRSTLTTGPAWRETRTLRAREPLTYYSFPTTAAVTAHDNHRR